VVLWHIFIKKNQKKRPPICTLKKVQTSGQ